MLQVYGRAFGGHHTHHHAHIHIMLVSTNSCAASTSMENLTRPRAPASRAQRSGRAQRRQKDTELTKRYWERSAVSGSIFAARRAGTRHAIAATATMTIGTATNVSASCGLMPYRNADSSLTPASAAASPNTTPPPTIQSA